MAAAEMTVAVTMTVPMAATMTAMSVTAAIRYSPGGSWVTEYFPSVPGLIERDAMPIR